MKLKFSLKVIRVLLALCAFLLISFTIVFFTFPLPGQIPVLMYHFIGTKDATETNGTVVTEKTFRSQMFFLKKLGYRVIPISEYDAILSGTQKPKGREIVLTFDDGQRSVTAKAIPILNELHFPVTLFLISRNLESDSDGVIKKEEAIELLKNPLISLGAHTRTHPFLSQISDEEVTHEIIGSKTELEAMLGVPIKYFAYPYGDFDNRSLDAVAKAGYRIAFTTSPKKLKKYTSGIYSKPRVKISENASNLWIFWIKVSGIYDSFKMWRHRQYQKNGAF